MKTIAIPYYRGTLDLHMDESNLKAVLEADIHCVERHGTEQDIVRAALAAPIGSPRLRELAKGKNKVVLSRKFIWLRLLRCWKLITDPLVWIIIR